MSLGDQFAPGGIIQALSGGMGGQLSPLSGNHQFQQFQGIPYNWLSTSRGTHDFLRSEEETHLPKALVAGPILAWRIWTVVFDASKRWMLSSLVQSTMWPPGFPLRGNILQHGVYAMKNKEDLMKNLPQYAVTSFVIGQVALWGVVIEHELGYRAECAYPYRLEFASPMSGFPRPAHVLEMAEGLRQTYGCEIQY